MHLTRLPAAKDVQVTEFYEPYILQSQVQLHSLELAQLLTCTMAKEALVSGLKTEYITVYFRFPLKLTAPVATAATVEQELDRQHIRLPTSQYCFASLV